MTMRNGSVRARRAALALLLAFALGACRSTDADLGMTAPQSTGAAALVTPGATGSIDAVPVAAAGTAVQFLPVVGAPPDQAAALSQALAAASASAGIAILPASAPAAPLRLKGYLSAIEEGPDTLVVYVWDVVDPAGTRVSRLQGQVRAPGTTGDPWGVVGPEAMKAVADQTMAALAGAPAAG